MALPMSAPDLDTDRPAAKPRDMTLPMVTAAADVVGILIVDDEPKNLTVLEAVLDDPRYRLVKAASAEDALLALLRDEFAVLILDVQMPGITGFELAQMIKERKKTSEIPIIFLTAFYNEDEHVIEGYDSGAVDYLLKPINPAILRSKVSVLVELHLKQRQLESANQALSAEVAERRLVQQQLSELNDTLELRVAERTEAYMQAERINRLLMNEVNHRSKNLLSVVLAVAQQTGYASAPDFVRNFSSRVQALAVNQDLLVENQWQSIEMVDLVRGQIAHFGDLVQRRFLVEGPGLRLSPSAAQSIGMAIHELSTNAVKYGALSTDQGTIALSWTTDLGATDQRFAVRWQEQGGPAVVAPKHRGFGTTVVTRMIEMGLGGRTQLDYESPGLAWSYSCDLARVLETGADDRT
jgi:two-component sensor histidine kinase/CheY-like chemotaxis protein